MLCIPARFCGFRKSILSMYSTEQQNDQTALLMMFFLVILFESFKTKTTKNLTL